MVFYHIAKAQLVEPHTTGMPGQEMSETPPTHLDPNVFADLKVLTYDASSINGLTLKQKELVYYLSQAALSGREIIYAQN